MTKRIELVDAIRGFALFGILLVHALEQFDLANYPEATGVLAELNIIIRKVVFFIFASKAYSIFSIMFGFSFFIQLNNREVKGEDFRLRFVWRLVILFIIGYIFSLFYIGEILTIFALLGLILVPMYKLKTPFLIILGVLFTIQIPTLYNLFISFTDNAFVHKNSWHHWALVSKTFMEGSFFDVVNFNSINGHLAKWQFMINTNRYIQMIGLFIVGLLLGRFKYFKNIDKHKKITLKVLMVCGLLALVFHYVPLSFQESTFSKVQIDLLNQLFSSYFNFVFTFFIIALFIVIYSSIFQKAKSSILINYGRMSLTNYVVQALFGTIFFYGYGFAMYKYFGATMCFLYGITFFVLQGFFCKFWLKHFYYGPLEWVWRAFTLMDFKLKFRKIN
jgi:uncharacterized protein